MQDGMTRRGLGAIAGLGALGLMAAPTTAKAAMSATETANLKLVKAFIKTWAAKDYDPDKVVPEYFAADCHVRVIDSQPFVTGPEAVAAAFKPYMTHGERFPVQFVSTYTAGPIVVTQRIDTTVVNGKPGKSFPMVGVFLVKNGKIQEWTDYVAA